MYIEKENKVKKAKVLTEDVLRQVIREVLFEAMSSFPNQYMIAEISANEFEKMFLNGSNVGKVQINKSGIKNIILKIEDGYFLSKVNVNFENKDLIISIGRDNWRNFEWNKLYEAISHELMHGNIFLSRDNNIKDKNKIDDSPESYDKIVEILNSVEDIDNLFYDYVYALYSCFYQETQALVSQTYSSMSYIYNKYGYDKIERDEFDTLLVNSKPYIIFSENIKLCDVLDQMTDNILEEKIVNEFKNWGLITTLFEIRKNINEIRRISNKALTKCMRNASLFYNELEKEGKIVK